MLAWLFKRAKIGWISAGVSPETSNCGGLCEKTAEDGREARRSALDSGPVDEPSATGDGASGEVVLAADSDGDSKVNEAEESRLRLLAWLLLRDGPKEDMNEITAAGRDWSVHIPAEIPIDLINFTHPANEP